MARRSGFFHLSLLAAVFISSCLPATESATGYSRYLAHIFRKYGNGGTMSFEGLEHLMYNLGLGQIEFEPDHTIEKHRPKGFQDTEPDNEQKLKTYFEQQTFHLQPHNEDEADESQGATEPLQHKSINSEDVDVFIRDRNVKEKGILLEFKEMHDPQHRHPRDNDVPFDSPPLSPNVCLSPKSLLSLVVDHDDLHKRKLYKTISGNAPTSGSGHNAEEEYNEFINHVKLTPVAFMKLCPALLAQIDQNICVRPAPLSNGDDPKQLMWNAWLYASVSIFVLSACGLFGILLVPLMKTTAYHEILNFLIAVAVGTLSGDALMHLLPHALIEEHSGHSSDSTPRSDVETGHDNTPVWICACAFMTAIVMYILENLLPLLKGENDAEGGHGHSHNHTDHSHSHGGHQHSHKTSSEVPPLPGTVSIDAKEINVMLDEAKKDEKKPSRPLTPLAFMVIIGDGLHNLTDGLAIGAAFASDPVTGMATAFAVLCHELPHELGDFALLLQTGVSIKRAVFLNIVSSVLSFAGMAVGLFIAGLHSNMTQWIYAATAGSFLYIALADLVPAMASEARGNFKASLIQITGMIVGGIIMLLIAVNEDALAVLFK